MRALALAALLCSAPAVTGSLQAASEVTTPSGLRIIDTRVGKGPQRWTMVVTVANPGDPTADPTKAWPADRRTVDVGTLVVQQIEAERDGRCRDINYDPTILPDGIRTSDDPFPAARSAAYMKSFDRRTAEEKDYPRTATGAKP